MSSTADEDHDDENVLLKGVNRFYRLFYSPNMVNR